MLRNSATAARKNFASLLDAAAAGESVLIERKGQVFEVTLVRGQAPAVATSPIFECDADVLAGEWSFSEDGVFSASRS